MALFKVDIEKEYQGEYWTNRYVVDTANIGDAVTAALAIIDAERAIHYNVINFTKARVSDSVQGTDLFTTIPIGAIGLRNLASNLLPLFNVMRVDFPVGQGRPSRKYYRGVLSEEVVSFNDVTQAVADLITNVFDPLVDTLPLVDVDGQAWADAVPFLKVAMRQLRRGSRKRTQPVVP